MQQNIVFHFQRVKLLVLIFLNDKVILIPPNRTPTHKNVVLLILIDGSTEYQRPKDRESTRKINHVFQQLNQTK